MATEFREFVNKAGTTYDPTKLDIVFAEDLNLLATAINALEEA